jgi:uncharacterized repeat protein (TIGR03803 family)
MNKINWWIRAWGVFLFWAAMAIATPAQKVKTVHTLDGIDGSNPEAALVQGANGIFYGTTTFGGANGCDGELGCGTVFSLTAGGKLTTLYSFCSQGGSRCPDGSTPTSGLVQGTDGDFYGTTYDGGVNGYGTVFKITPGGALATLYSFDNTDGAQPHAGLIQAADGKFYGTTYEGGPNSCGIYQCGTIFTITVGGTLTTLHSFDGTDGQNPNGLVQGDDGRFYGTTILGGASDRGTVFSITPSGKLTTVHSFCSQGAKTCTDGTYPQAGLIQATDGNFYGTAGGGGANFYGTVFRLTPSGTLTTLHSFDFTDGAYPNAALVEGTNGDFYGVTDLGGTGTDNSCILGCGTIFSITLGGKFRMLGDFDVSDGANPVAGLIEATNGTLYGTTEAGGASSACSGGCGTVFSLSVGLK